MLSRPVLSVASSILLAGVAVVFAQPPSSYGPPNFSPPGTIKTFPAIVPSGGSGSGRPIIPSPSGGGGSPGSGSGGSPGGSGSGPSGSGGGGRRFGGTFFSGGSGEGGEPEPFSYAYEVKDSPSGNDFSSHADSDGKRVQGEYRVLLPDGRRQIVKYTADDGGYMADVQYEGQARYPVHVPQAPQVIANSASPSGSPIIASSGGTIISSPVSSPGPIIARGPSTPAFGGYRY